MVAARPCCGRARSLGLDDVGFLDAVLDDVARRVEIDATRIYEVGESNGAMLAYQYAAVRSHRTLPVRLSTADNTHFWAERSSEASPSP